MYLHIGNQINIRERDIIGIFDADRTTTSWITRKYLSEAQKRELVSAASEEIPKSFVLYRDRKKLKSKNILVFSPNEIFSNYIAGVIPELGEQEVMTTTFAEMIQRYCGSAVTEMYEQIEFLATAPDTPQNRVRKLGIRLKGSREFPQLVKRFVEDYVPPFESIEFQGKMILPAETMCALYTDRFGHMNRVDRLAAVYSEIERLVGPVQQRYIKEKEAELIANGFV